MPGRRLVNRFAEERFVNGVFVPDFFANFLVQRPAVIAELNLVRARRAGRAIQHADAVRPRQFRVAFPRRREHRLPLGQALRALVRDKAVQQRHHFPRGDDLVLRLRRRARSHKQRKRQKRRRKPLQQPVLHPRFAPFPFNLC